MSNASFSAFELKAGSIYRVKVSFTDHEARVHSVGEFWRFVNQAFLPYHAGLTLNVVDSRGPRCIFLQDYPEAQGEIIAHFSDYVVEAVPPVIDARPPDPPA